MVRNILVPMNRVNIPALVAGILILYILYTGAPWWTLTALGESPTFKADVAPYLISIEILDKPVDSPILKYIMLSGMISYLLIGVTCLAAAFIPDREWSKPVIGYRAIIMIFLTLTTLYFGLYMVRRLIGVSLPFYGTATALFKFPYETGTINVYTPVKAVFTQTFYLAVIAAILAAIGRILTGKSGEEEE